MTMSSFPGVYFQPWIGSRFQAGFDGVQLLILGESHYVSDGDEAGPDFTIKVVDWHGVTKRGSRFFTKATNAVVSNGQLTPEERSDFWQSVAFYNFIQSPVGNGPRVRPTAEMWTQAAKPFFEVLDLLSPECILVLGQDLWSHLPPGLAYEGIIMSDSSTLEARVYHTSNGDPILASYVKHPSGRGFRYSETRPRIEALVFEAKRKFDWR